MSALILSTSQLSSLITAARADLVEMLVRDHGESVKLLSPAQAAGMLDVHPKTLTSLPIPRIVLTPKVIKYRLADISAYIASVREK
jgi:hypothetical protein